MTVSLHCGILWTKVEVVGLAWSSRASLTNSPTVITPGIVMPHKGELFLSTVHCSARAILSQHLLHRRKNSAQIFFGENFTTSSCDGGRSSTEARRALLRPPLLPPHHCKHTLGYYYRAARAFNSHLPDHHLFGMKTYQVQNK